MSRVGIIGARGVGAIHAAVLESVPDVEVTMIAGSTKASAATAARRLGVKRWTADAAELVTDSDVDAVHVCSPNDLHFDAVRLALASGKHVLCEKPLTLAPAQADLLAATAHSYDGITAVAYHYRYWPLVSRLRQLIAGGRLGALHTIRACYLQNWGLDRPHSWRSNPDQGGRSRVLNDIGVHLLDLVEFVSGTRYEVLHTTFTGLDGATPGSDDVAIAMSHSTDGVGLSFLASQVAAGSSNGLSIAVDGRTGSAEWSLSDSERVTVTDAAAASSLRTDVHAPASVAGEFWRAEPAPEGARRAMFTDFYTAVATGMRPARLPSFADGARHVRLVADASEALVDAKSTPAEAVQRHLPAPISQSQGGKDDPALSA